MKAWGGRFTSSVDPRAEGFTSSISFDRRLYKQDIAGSIAHARMLEARGIIDSGDMERIVSGLKEILREIDEGVFEFRTADEDIHLNIERRLVEKIGETGGKLHTARSRNDQVAVDTRLYTLDSIETVKSGIAGLQTSIVARAKEHLGAIMPGYTHLQRAQPVLFSHHLMAYFWMLLRDYRRFSDCGTRTAVSPLGAGALAGTTHDIDPEMTAGELGLPSVFDNSVDAVADRDYIIEFISSCALLMMHLSRMCEELVVWSSAEFGFIEMHDSFATGSSIMPQKKNPDVAELIRGKTGRVYGDLVALLTTMKGLPLAYHSDMQEDKERLFDAVDTAASCLGVCAGMIDTMKVNKERMEDFAAAGFINATEVADYLAGRGIPFRKAHEVTGRIVRYCIDKGISISDMSLGELKRFSAEFAEDVYELLSPESCVSRRKTRGGTAPERVREQIESAEKILASMP